MLAQSTATFENVVNFLDGTRWLVLKLDIFFGRDDSDVSGDEKAQRAV